jgi:Na+/phosphate symporter
MAAALPDKAWGRDSAVYRVAGVVTVISGWFFTAFMATSVSAIIALIINYTEIYGLAGMLIFTGFLLFRTSKIHKDKEIEKENERVLNSDEDDNDNSIRSLLKNIVKDIVVFVNTIQEVMSNSYNGLIENDIKILKKSRVNGRKVNKKLNSMVRKIVELVKMDHITQDLEFELVTVTSICQDIADKIANLSEQNYSYLDNNHNKLFEEQMKDIKEMIIVLDNFSKLVIKSLKPESFISIEVYNSKEKNFREQMIVFNKNQINRIRKMSSSMKRNILMFNILNDVESIGISILRIAVITQKLRAKVISLPESNIIK